MPPIAGKKLYFELREQDPKAPGQTEKFKNVEIRMKAYFNELEIRRNIRGQYKKLLNKDYFQEAFKIIEERSIPQTVWAKLTPYAVMVYNILDEAKILDENKFDNETANMLSHMVEYYRLSPLVKDKNKSSFLDTQEAILGLYPAILEMIYNKDYDVFRHKFKFMNDQLNSDKIKLEYSFGLDQYLDEDFRNKYETATNKEDLLELTDEQKQQDKFIISVDNIVGSEPGPVVEPTTTESTTTEPLVRPLPIKDKKLSNSLYFNQFKGITFNDSYDLKNGYPYPFFNLADASTQSIFDNNFIASFNLYHI